jgi:hypothetical protein
MNTEVQTPSPLEMGEQEDNVSQQTSKKKINVILVLIISLLLLGTSILGYFIFSKRSELNQKDFVEESKDIDQLNSEPIVEIVPDTYEVLLKVNTQDSNKTDVYLKNLENNVEEFFLTISDVYREHAKSAEYHNGNLYIIRRVGYDGYPDEDFSDELWRYNSQKRGTELYSTKGLSFSVKPDETRIAIKADETIVFLDNSGEALRSFQEEDLVEDSGNVLAYAYLDFLAWRGDSVWLTNTHTGKLRGLTKINVNTYVAKKYDLGNLSIGKEYTLNVDLEKVAYSNYPVFLEVEAFEEYERSGAEVILKVYDLNTKNSEFIASSITKEFEPKWINENILEYNNPNGVDRVQKTIK